MKIKHLLVLTFAFVLHPYAVSNPKLPQYEGVIAFRKGDYQTAFRELQPLAKQGNTDAQIVMGRLFQNGWGVELNDSVACDYFYAAAMKKVAHAIDDYAWCYKSGVGREKNMGEAKIWFQNGANLGYGPSEFELGLIEQEKRNITKSFSLITSAAEKGYPPAQNALGLSYLFGSFGAPKNSRVGLMWLIISEDFVGEAWKNNTKKIKKEYSEQDIFSAEELAKECKAKELKGCY